MDERVEEDGLIDGPGLDPTLGERLGERGIRRADGHREPVDIEVIARHGERHVEDVWAEWRLQRRDLHQSEPCRRHELGREALDRRVVALHVADHERDPRVARRRDHRPPFGRREAHRLLDEDVQPRPGGRDRGQGVRSGGGDEHGIERRLEQLLPASHACRDGEPFADGRENRRRQVADRLDRVPVRELAQVGEVHDLGDQPAADDPDPERRAGRRATRDAHARPLLAPFASPVRAALGPVFIVGPIEPIKYQSRKGSRGLLDGRDVGLVGGEAGALRPRPRSASALWLPHSRRRVRPGRSSRTDRSRPLMLSTTTHDAPSAVRGRTRGRRRRPCPAACSRHATGRRGVVGRGSAADRTDSSEPASSSWSATLTPSA